MPSRRRSPLLLTVRSESDTISGYSCFERWFVGGASDFMSKHRYGGPEMGLGYLQRLVTPQPKPVAPPSEPVAPGSSPNYFSRLAPSTETILKIASAHGPARLTNSAVAVSVRSTDLGSLLMESAAAATAMGLRLSIDIGAGEVPTPSRPAVILLRLVEETR